MIKIYYWPDGTWCHQENIDEYDWMSDDYAVIGIPPRSDEDIDALINQILLDQVVAQMIEDGDIVDQGEEK